MAAMNSCFASVIRSVDEIVCEYNTGDYDWLCTLSVWIVQYSAEVIMY